VHGDPYLSSRLNAELALLHDRLAHIVRSIEDVQDQAVHTEQRVDVLETRVEQLELRPAACTSDVNHTLSLQLCRGIVPRI